MKQKTQRKLSKKAAVTFTILAVVLTVYTGFTIFINRRTTAYINLEDLKNGVTPLIAYDMPAPNINVRKAGSLPQPDDKGERDLRFLDLTNIDLSDKTDELMRASFSSKTIWPQDISDSFSPGLIMELGMNPGLNVRELHKNEVNGEGVGVAIIDYNLLAGHEQYADRLRIYELFKTVEKTAVMHSAVASIAVGKDTGVTPRASLYYIAAMCGTYLPPFALVHYSILVKCIDRILEINTYLPENEKIRVVSISRGFAEYELGAKNLKQAIDRANNAGVFVITCSPEINFGFRLMGLGREPMSDPDELSSYTISLFDSGTRARVTSDILFIPIDSRTTAGFTGVSDYIFYRRGGWSWAAPWLAGMYALCVQVYPDITPELFITLAFETGDVLQTRKIINPVRLIDKLKSGIF